MRDEYYFDSHLGYFVAQTHRSDLMNNRLHNATNPNQGTYKKVLCVCSAGLLRSPTLAFTLSQRGYNTRAAGSSPGFALVPVDEVLIHWADEIVFVNRENHDEVAANFPSLVYKDVIVLDLPDRYRYRDPELVSLCDKQYDDAMMLKQQVKTKD